MPDYTRVYARLDIAHFVDGLFTFTNGQPRQPFTSDRISRARKRVRGVRRIVDTVFFEGEEQLGPNDQDTLLAIMALSGPGNVLLAAGPSLVRPPSDAELQLLSDLACSGTPADIGIATLRKSDILTVSGRNECDSGEARQMLEASLARLQQSWIIEASDNGDERRSRLLASREGPRRGFLSIALNHRLTAALGNDNQYEDVSLLERYRLSGRARLIHAAVSGRTNRGKTYGVVDDKGGGARLERFARFVWPRARTLSRRDQATLRAALDEIVDKTGPLHSANDGWQLAFDEPDVQNPLVRLRRPARSPTIAEVSAEPHKVIRKAA